MRKVQFDSVASRFRWKPCMLMCIVGFTFLLGNGSASAILAQNGNAHSAQPREVVIELFYRSDSKQSQAAHEYLKALAKARTGIKVKAYDVLKDAQQRTRLWQVSKKLGLKKAQVPTFYLCNRIKVGFRDAATSGAQVESLLNIKAYVRPGCKHCQAGKAFLDDLVARWPALRVEYYDVVADPKALQEVQQLTARYQVKVPSFPCIHVAGRLVVGFQSAEITGANIEALFQDRSQPPRSQPQTTPTGRPLGKSEYRQPFHSGLAMLSAPTWLNGQGEHPAIQQDSVIDPALPEEAGGIDDLPQEALPDEAPLPDESSADEPHDQIIGEDVLMQEQGDEIEVPWLGQLSVSELGLPAFTFLIGLVDGFNPCAMWVLVFLLSVLVNIKERKKILMVAGTFIVVSGLAYFVFMAAWFSVFQLVGLLRPVQIGLGIMAVLIGLINVKDFFAFHKGLTLSIPESAKPGIYRRVRKIVSANQMTTALSGAIVLAIVVNIVELLCTAGLPALYTEILTMQELPAWANYSYLALYISAYMLDDTILVAIVVTTLSHRRLQESEGRYLKLLSGLVILSLGLVMLFWPDALL